jgi:hypothetical protein
VLTSYGSQVGCDPQKQSFFFFNWSLPGVFHLILKSTVRQETQQIIYCLIYKLAKFIY